MSSDKTIIIRNTKKGITELPTVNGVRYILGSVLDKMIVDPNTPKPEIKIPIDAWKIMKARKDVQGMIASGEIEEIGSLLSVA